MKMSDNMPMRPEENGRAGSEILKEATESLRKNKQYRKLLERYETARRSGQVIQQINLNKEIKLLEQAEIDRLVELHNRRSCRSYAS